MNFSEFAESRNNTSPTAPLATSGINGEPVNMANKNVAKTLDLMTKDFSYLIMLSGEMYWFNLTNYALRKDLIGCMRRMKVFYSNFLFYQLIFYSYHKGCQLN